MEDSIVIAAGYPHELLGHIKRLNGADTIAYFEDSEQLLKDYKDKYADYESGVRELEVAVKLGIISEMVSILGEPLWRKRSFINKSAIRMMNEEGFREYEMVELLESFMQLFEWYDIEMVVPRRWTTSEEDSVEWYRENSDRTVHKTEDGEKNHGREYIRQEEAASKDDAREEIPDNDNDEDDEAAGQDREALRPAQTIRTTGAGDLADSAGSGGSENNMGGVSYESQKSSGYVDSKRQVDYSHFVEDSEVVRLDYVFKKMTPREFIASEIIKSGLKFERLMISSIKRDARRAINGNADAQCRMGAFYAEPDTSHTDYLEAVKWYKLSASQGNSKAQFELGMLYDTGKIKCDDYKMKAIKCYLTLAEAGFPTAQCTIGLKYRFGDGVDENIEEAIKWLSRAANQGHVDAQRHLGDVYSGIGKEKEAARWYRRAAASGDQYSSKRLK